MVTRMGVYSEVKKKIDKLERRGYLNKGDSSVSYLTENKDIVVRFFNDDLTTETIAHLKNKLEQYLTENKMIFQISLYGLTIIPDFRIADIINEALSYDEMKIQLKKLPFIRIMHSKDFVKISFVSNNITFRLSANAFNPVLCDWVHIYNCPGQDSLVIKSEKCRTENEIANIDKLF